MVKKSINKISKFTSTKVKKEAKKEKSLSKVPIPKSALLPTKANTMAGYNQASGWFREESTNMWPGQAMSLKVNKILLRQQTKYQDLAVFENGLNDDKQGKKGPWGNVMTLDGVIQITNRDEFVYHEMMAHLPLSLRDLNNKKQTQKVLIIGGGDGGVLREVLKHPSVAHVDLVDIDAGVIEAAKKYFPVVSEALLAVERREENRANIMVGDGAKFISDFAKNNFKNEKNKYDVIIVDSSDPEGPASVLFGEEFYRNVKNSLKSDGIVCSQGESIWLHSNLIEKMMNFLKNDIKFSTVKYGMIYIPSYPCGSIGALICSKKDIDLTKPLSSIENITAFNNKNFSNKIEKEKKIASTLKYYNSKIHQAAFVLPNFAARFNE